MGKIKDLRGHQHGRLTVIMDTGKRLNKGVAWMCRCICGNLVHIRSSSLQTGNTESCGCLERDLKRKMNSKRTGTNNPGFKHGDTMDGKQQLPYGTWHNFIQRCENPNDRGYKYYGGRGIKVCDGWKEYLPFKEWALTTGYVPGLTIDRIDNNGDYEPSNCQWLTRAAHGRKTYADQQLQEIEHDGSDI